MSIEYPPAAGTSPRTPIGPDSPDMKASYDFRNHSVLIDFNARTVRVFSNEDATPRAWRRDWRKVRVLLDRLGADEPVSVPCEAGSISRFEAMF